MVKKKKQKNDNLVKSFYKSYKNSFDNIIDDDFMRNKINDAIIRTNKIIVRGYMVLRLYLLKNYDDNKLDIFNNKNKKNETNLEDIIRDIFIVICKKGGGKRRFIDEEFQKFYNNTYQILQQDKEELFDKVNLNQILSALLQSYLV